MFIVLILVLVWLAILIPFGLRRIGERQASLSLTSFHIALHGMRRTQPRSSTASALEVSEHVARRGVVRTQSGSTAARRRKTVTMLGVTIFATLVLGAIPALRTLWYLSLTAAILALCYLGALAWVVRNETLSSERRRKVVRLQGAVSRVPLAHARASSGGDAGASLQPAFRIIDARRQAGGRS